MSSMAYDPTTDPLTYQSGWDVPDYKSLLSNDSSFEAAQAAAAQAQENAAAARRAALRTAVIRYGGMPTGFKDQYGDIDQATLDAANANQQSTLSGIKQNYGTSERQFRQQLAARGALQSGDLNYGEDQLSRGLAQNEYDAANATGDQATSAFGQYSGVLNTNAWNLSSALQEAMARLAQQYQPTPTYTRAPYATVPSSPDSIAAASAPPPSGTPALAGKATSGGFVQPSQWTIKAAGGAAPTPSYSYGGNVQRYGI